MGSFLNVVALEYGKLMKKQEILEKKDKQEEEQIKDFLGLKSYWKEFIYILKQINRRSHCPTCGEQLKTLDLFPIFSYLFNLGKCRYCGAKISPRYLIVEIFSGLVFLFLFLKLFPAGINESFFLNFGLLTVIFSSLIIIFLLDAIHKEVPLLPYYFGLTFSFIFLWINKILNFEILKNAIITAIPFYLIYRLTVKNDEDGNQIGGWMGSFDWKLIFMLTLFLVSFQEKYSFIVLSFWYGAIYSLILMYLSKKYDFKSEVPFGPFIILSFWTVFLFKVDILALTAKIMNLFS